MTPKTIIEKRITELSASLAPVSADITAWAEKSIFLKWGVLSRGKFHCLECSHAWKPDSTKSKCQNYIKCAGCTGKLKMQPYNKTHFKEIEYSAVLDTAGDFQVVRIICSHKQMKKGFAPTYFHKEVMQHWINPKGEVRTMSLSVNVFSQFYDQWKFYSPLEIRPKDFQNSPKYRIAPYRVYPKLKVISSLKRNGFKTSLHNMAPQLLFSAILKDSLAETLLKASQISMLTYYVTSSEQHLKQNWQAVKTCLKYSYVISDYRIWEDYIDLLRWFKKDLSCPLYVCPNNLSESHDRLVRKKRAIQRRKYLMEMRTEILEAQSVYAEEKKDFFGLCFSEKNLTVSVIENVQDFMAEGDNLHHCVFTNEYYKKKNSLILSAKVDSQSVETIELSLKNMEIIQCRGLKNNASKHHKQILSLMNRNLYQIKERIKKRTVN
ncbi:PcfJ domain-containing protein [Flavobacterium sp. YJ01]|uniref:PcfJ domain-containing protein n=1 Tax=Flavobacterium sp. YJ01 TaxID=3031997 RepID=UPI0023E4166F|nr:PcfJ domain-containing protein [Flavobacterium sp. YJ01]WET03962.1 PcfJ domain-containing protein [Flavobacterium sp. YJ01]